MLVALGLNTVGVILGSLNTFFLPAYFFLLGAATAIVAIRLFDEPVKPAKTVNIQRSFPVFIRIAYGWLVIAAALSIWAAASARHPEFGGPRVHALTVGFIAAMIFCVGQRTLPSFCGMRVLWSPKLMLVMLSPLDDRGCTLRVASEILAYQDYATWAWNILPVSALIELTAVAYLRSI